MLKQRSHLRGYSLLLGVLLVSLVDGKSRENCDCSCSFTTEALNVCDVVSEIKSITDSNSAFLTSWVNHLITFRDWFYNKQQHISDLLEDAIVPHIDRKIEKLAADKISSGNSAREDKLEARINEVESVLLQRSNELLLRIKEAESSLKEKGELLDQLRETEQELKGELASERQVREQLEENLHKTQEVVISLVASEKVRADAIQKNISSSAENFYENYIRGINDRLKVLNEDKRNLNKKVNEIDAAVKDCASSQSVSMLDERLQNLNYTTNVVVDNFTHELSPHLQNLEKKIKVVHAAVNVTLENQGSHISKIWSHLYSLQKHHLSETQEETCPNSTADWVDVGEGLCYLFVTESNFTWYEANFDCQTKGGVLTSIRSENETHLLQSHMKGKKGNLYIGLHRSPSDNDRFEWLDGSEFSYSNWKKDQPNNYGKSQACGIIGPTALKWSDVECFRGRGYICSSRHTPVSKKLSYSLCPSPAWVEGSEHWCYFFGTETHLTWDEANYDCLRRGGDLLIINSEKERDILHGLISKMSGAFWIGLRRSLTNHDSFVWVNGKELTYSYWMEEEPNNAEEKEICVEMRTPSSRWNDLPCNTKTSYICSARRIKAKLF